MMCPTCNEDAQYRIYRNDSDDFPAGPSIRVCHSEKGAYLHVIGDEE